MKKISFFLLERMPAYKFKAFRGLLIWIIMNHKEIKSFIMSIIIAFIIVSGIFYAMNGYYIPLY